MMTRGRRIRLLLAGLAVIVGISCAPVTPSPAPAPAPAPAPQATDAILSRGGGITGMSETVTLWVEDGQAQGRWTRSDRAGPSEIRLPSAEILATLRDLESAASSQPKSPRKTERGPVCADYILMRLEIQSGESKRVVQEECPHRTEALETYWRRLHTIFDNLVNAAR